MAWRTRIHFQQGHYYSNEWIFCWTSQIFWTVLKFCVWKGVLNWKKTMFKNKKITSKSNVFSLFLRAYWTALTLIKALYKMTKNWGTINHKTTKTKNYQHKRKHKNQINLQTFLLQEKLWWLKFTESLAGYSEESILIKKWFLTISFISNRWYSFG